MQALRRPGFTCGDTYLGFLSFGFLGWHVGCDCGDSARRWLCSGLTDSLCG